MRGPARRMARVAVAVTEADAVAGDQRRNQVVHDSLNELLQYLDTNSGRGKKR